jgi:lysophospholipase L1-like esterase
MKRSPKGVIAVVLISVMITAGILEGAIRVFHLIPDNLPITYHPVAGDEGFAPDPNSSGRSILGILHRTNSLGLRGPERSFVRSPGRARVAVVGDSVVWGYGIPEEETITGWLERLAVSRGLGLEAWNLGVECYNTYNEKAKYARLAPLLRPDVTIVIVLFNDLQPGARHFRITSVRTLADQRRRAPYPDDWRPILEKSALFHAAIRLYLYAVPPDGGVEAFNLVNLPGIIGQLDEIRSTASGVGSALIVAAMPSAWPDADRFARLSNGLKRFCEERQIPFADLSSVLGSPARSEYLLPADPVHPTAEGTRLVAEALLPYVGEALKHR